MSENLSINGISVRATLNKESSPYSVSGQIRVEKDKVIAIENGVVLKKEDNSNVGNFYYTTNSFSPSILDLNETVSIIEAILSFIDLANKTDWNKYGA